MKKTLLTVLSTVIVLSMCVATALAAGPGSGRHSQIRTETVSATTLAAGAPTEMRMETAFAITMAPDRTGDVETDAASRAAGETVSGVVGADKQQESPCRANRRHAEPLSGIPIPFSGSARYICAAACAYMLFILLGGRWLYFTPTFVKCLYRLT